MKKTGEMRFRALWFVLISTLLAACGNSSDILTINPAHAQVAGSEVQFRQLGGQFPQGGIDVILGQTGTQFSGEGAVRIHGNLIPFSVSGYESESLPGYIYLSLQPIDQSTATDEMTLQGYLETGDMIFNDSATGSTIEFSLASQDELKARVIDATFEVNPKDPERFSVNMAAKPILGTSSSFPGRVRLNASFSLDTFAAATIHGPALVGDFTGNIFGEPDFNSALRPDSSLITGRAFGNFYPFTNVSVLYLEGTRKLNSGTGVNAAAFVIDRVAVNTKFIFDRSPFNSAGTTYPIKTSSFMAVEMIRPIPQGPVFFEFFTGVYSREIEGQVTLVSPGSLPFK